MSDLFDLKCKIKFTVLYKNVFCSSILYQQTSYEKLPDVLYVTLTQGVVEYVYTSTSTIYIPTSISIYLYHMK